MEKPTRLDAVRVTEETEYEADCALVDRVIDNAQPAGTPRYRHVSLRMSNEDIARLKVIKERLFQLMDLQR